MKRSLRQKISQEINAFGKAQVSAFTGGVVDYLVMVAAVEIFHVSYIYGIVIGGIIGAIVNYSINHSWTFKSSASSVDSSQILKFAFTVIGSISLKSAGTYLFVNWLGLDYKLARIIVDAFVSFGFNYTLQRLWVFKGSQT